jgi:hypothetical protein
MVGRPGLCNVYAAVVTTHPCDRKLQHRGDREPQRIWPLCKSHPAIVRPDREGHRDAPWDFSSAGLHEDKAERRKNHWIKTSQMSPIVRGSGVHEGLARLCYRSIPGMSVMAVLSCCPEDAEAHTDSACSRSRNNIRVVGGGPP